MITSPLAFLPKGLLSSDLLFFLIGLVSGFSAFAGDFDSRKFYQYEFDWGFVPVASLEIDLNQISSDGLIRSKGETKGLSKIFKSYSANVRVRKINDSTHYYELLGSDRGVKETRKINFVADELPDVLEFKDSTSQGSLTPRQGSDEGSVDPLTVLAWFYSEDSISMGCIKEFKVFDGKRRFTIEIEPLSSLTNFAGLGSRAIGSQKTKLEADNSLLCRITMSVRSSERRSLAEKDKKLSLWPFNKKDQIIDVSLGIKDSNMAYIQKIVIYSPLGKIIGRLV